MYIFFCIDLDNLEVRLVNGYATHAGRVEVYYQGDWGTICDDDWDYGDANVVCKMIGYPSAWRSSKEAEFGKGTGNITLGNVECSGLEDNIGLCWNRGYYSTDCDHSKDAGVVCSEVEGMMIH